MGMMDLGAWGDGFDDVFGDTVDHAKNLVVIIDHSASLEGTSLGVINNFMENLLAELKDKNGVAFTTCLVEKEVVFKPDNCVLVSDDTVFERLAPGSLTHLGQAFTLIDKKLKTDDFLFKGETKTDLVLLLISDGYATDSLEKGLKLLEGNSEFKKAKKYCLTPSEICDDEMIDRFCGSAGRRKKLESSELENCAREIVSFLA